MNIIRERELTEVDLSRLAREVARKIKPLELILQQLQISPQQWDRIQQSPIFTTRMGEEAAIWSASTRSTVRERVSIKAAVMIEELLIEAVGIVQDPLIPGAARVQALRFIADMGELGEKAAVTDDSSGRVTININLGSQKLKYDKEAPSRVIEGQVQDVVEEA
jgi:hypothetical protein